MSTNMEHVEHDATPPEASDFVGDASSISFPGSRGVNELESIVEESEPDLEADDAASCDAPSLDEPITPGDYEEIGLFDPPSSDDVSRRSSSSTAVSRNDEVGPPAPPSSPVSMDPTNCIPHEENVPHTSVTDNNMHQPLPFLYGRAVENRLPHTHLLPGGECDPEKHIPVFVHDVLTSPNTLAYILGKSNGIGLQKRMTPGFVRNCAVRWMPSLSAAVVVENPNDTEGEVEEVARGMVIFGLSRESLKRIDMIYGNWGLKTRARVEIDVKVCEKYPLPNGVAGSSGSISGSSNGVSGSGGGEERKQVTAWAWLYEEDDKTTGIPWTMGSAVGGVVGTQVRNEGHDGVRIDSGCALYHYDEDEEKSAGCLGFATGCFGLKRGRRVSGNGEESGGNGSGGEQHVAGGGDKEKMRTVGLDGTKLGNFGTRKEHVKPFKSVVTYASMF